MRMTSTFEALESLHPTCLITREELYEKVPLIRWVNKVTSLITIEELYVLRYLRCLRCFQLLPISSVDSSRLFWWVVLCKTHCTNLNSSIQYDFRSNTWFVTRYFLYMANIFSAALCNSHFASEKERCAPFSR